MIRAQKASKNSRLPSQARNVLKTSAMADKEPEQRQEKRQRSGVVMVAQPRVFCQIDRTN
jgi:hypothetical protein